MAELEQILSALSSPIRREILWLAWHDERTAGEIANSFAVSGPTISQHLRVLRDAELVTMTVDGNFRRYRTQRDQLAAFEPYLREGKAEKWALPAALRPAGQTVEAETAHLTRARVNLAQSPAKAFAFFVEREYIEQWSGENAISNPRHGGTFGFDAMGRTCRGVYWRFHPPSVLVLHWGFADGGKVPVPSDVIETTVFFSAGESGTDIEVVQPAAGLEEAEFFAMAWTDRLRRLKELADSLFTETS